MFGTIRNLLYVLKRFKVATATNLVGLTLSFVAFILVMIHVRYEYGFDSAIQNRECIFQMENLRDDGIWESNFSRPQLERFIASSPYIKAAAITNNLAYSSFEFGVSSGTGPDATTYAEKLDRITPGFTEVFGFEFVAGSAACLEQPEGIIMPESKVEKYFGDHNPIGRTLYMNDFKDMDHSFSMFGIDFNYMGIVGGVYRDFPENTRVKNVIYTPIREGEMMNAWNTGSYYCYLLLFSPEQAQGVVDRYMTEHGDFLKSFTIEDIRLKALPELYFKKQVRAEATPSGNKLRTNMLFFIAVLVVLIALVNYINLSLALAPIRMKSITTRKVMGCAQSVLQKHLVYESILISLVAFVIAVLFVIVLKDNRLLTDMFGHPLSLSSHVRIFIWAAVLAIGAGTLAGIYPAFYITSFPPASAINGSFSLTPRAKNTRKLLIGFQYVISITLIISSLFITLQNKFIEKVDLGFDKENILEVRLSIGTALTKSQLFRELALGHPDIKEVAFSEFKFVSDESKTTIGYNYRSEHSYMNWRGVSPNFPQVMGLEIVAGRSFLADDELHGNDRAVCIINESAARDIVSRLSETGPVELTELVGTNIIDNNIPVQIVGIFKDFHFESLYREVKPFAFWVSARNSYRRFLPENYSYIKIAAGNPEQAISHIRKVSDVLNPGYPVDIRFFDKSLEELYQKSHNQGLLVTLFCLLAVILSLVGVFGLVIFESQGREKEIAIRKVFGATIRQILWMFNTSFLKIVGVGFILSVPSAWYGVNKWLQSFAYKTPLYVWVFGVGLLVITILTVLTVTLQSYRTAIANPAQKLHR